MKDQLEQLVDQFGFHVAIDLLMEICRDRADHFATPSAPCERWQRRCNALAKLWEDVE